MSDQLFDALFHLLNVANLRQHLGYKIILLLTILVNYRKNEVNFLILFMLFIIIIIFIIHANVVSESLYNEAINCR